MSNFDFTDSSSFNYVEEPNPNLLCSICRFPFLSPKTGPCGHIFCYKCILNQISISEVCPLDRTPISESNIAPANRIICNLVDELAVVCPNFSRGCKQNIQRQQVPSHINDYCEYSLKPCLHSGCNAEVLKKDFDEHCSSCLYSLVVCEFCGKDVLKKDLQEHLLACSEKERICIYCKIKYTESGHQLQCVKRTVECTAASVGCSWKGEASHFEDHETNCPFIKLEPLLKEQQLQYAEAMKQNKSFQDQISLLIEEVHTLKDKVSLIDEVSQFTSEQEQLKSNQVLLRNEVKFISEHLGTIEMRPPLLTLLNDHHRMREEVQLLGLKYHSLSKKLELLSERHRGNPNEKGTVEQVAKVLSASAKWIGSKGKGNEGHKQQETKL